MESTLVGIWESTGLEARAVTVMLAILSVYSYVVRVMEVWRKQGTEAIGVR